jgi:hypothetical protein
VKASFIQLTLRGSNKARPVTTPLPIEEPKQVKKFLAFNSIQRMTTAKPSEVPAAIPQKRPVQPNFKEYKDKVDEITSKIDKIKKEMVLNQS